jgi:Bacterial Ig-like domain (group 3)/Galactose oxidase, central domain/Kelch motif
VRRYSKYYLTSIAILISALLIHAQFVSTPVNRWTQSAEMSAQRASACSVQMADGRVLVAGGRNDAAVLSTVDVSGADGTFSPAAPMSQARADAACIALPDGRVLVTGGSDGKAALATAEVYDAKSDSWQSLGSMAVARTGHTATATPWGAILLAGGEDTGTVELFLTNDTFRTLGALTTSRANYAIAATVGHKIVIAGGSHGNSTLSTVEIYDGDTTKIVPGGAMLVARKNFAAAPLLDGTVLLTGGYGADGSILSSSEIFDPEHGTSVAGPAMSAARANHKASVLPSNGRVLLVGGADENGVTASTEMYTPWTRNFGSVAPMHTARQQMGTAPIRRGAIVVVGGKGPNGPLSGSETFGFATIDTDKSDYAPGERATFSGTGWKPGEQVLVQVAAFPLDQHSVEFTAVAQADSVGRITTTPFNVDRSHLGVRFLATATGSESQAQNFFTDGNATSISFNVSSIGNQFGLAVGTNGHVQDISATPVNPVVSGTVNIAVDGTVYTSPSLATLMTGDYIGASIATLQPGTHVFSAAYTGGGPQWGDVTASAISYRVTSTTVTALNSPAPGSGVFGTAVLFKATVTSNLGANAPGSGTVEFHDLSGGGNVIIVTAPVDPTGVAQASVSNLPGKAYSVAAVFVPSGSAYSTSTSAATTYTVTPKSPAITTNISPAPPISVGQPVSITSCVTTVANIPATGTMVFTINGTQVSGERALATNGCATLPLYTALTGGPTTISVTYFPHGDPNYTFNALGVGDLGPFTVGKAASTSSVTSSPVTPVGYGATVQLIGTVTSAAVATTGLQIGGTATFQVDGADVSTCIGVTVANGRAVCNLTTALTVGTHPVVLKYLSDTNYGTSDNLASPYNLVVNPSPSTISTPTSSAGTTYAYGNTTTFTAAVSPHPGAPAFGGGVQFFDGIIPVGAAVVPDATGSATSAAILLSAGPHAITAKFAGDANYGPSPLSGSLAVSVSKATPVITLTAPAPAYITTYGGLLTTGVTNVAASLAGVVPTGTITLSSGGVVIATATLDGSGNFTFTNVPMPAAINVGAGQNLTVTYNGDSNYATAVLISANGLTVNAATSTAVVTSAPISPVAYNQNVTFRVRLTGPGNPATGTINFTSDGAAINATCTGATVANNLAQCTVAATVANHLGAGSHNITVSGFTEANGDHVLGAVTALNPFVVSPPAPQIVITSNQNPSAYGQAVTFTATVSGPVGAPAPTGQLQFYDGSGTIGALQTIQTSAANVVTYTLTVPSGSIPTLTGGTHAISATYVPLGDPNYAQGVSQTQTPPSVLQQVVNRAASQTVANASAVPVVAAVNITPAASVYGQAVSFAVDIIPATGNVGTPTGIVIFKADGFQFGPAVTIQSVGLIQRATLPNFSGLSRGTHGITAEYQGDTNFNASATNSTSFTVDYDATKITLSNLPPNATYGASITLTAQVCGLVAGSATLCNGALPVGPSSTISFFDGSTLLGASGPVDATGTGSITITMQNPPLVNPVIGNHTITARYNGHGSPGGDDTNFAQSTSAAQILAIGRAATNSSVASNANPSVTGQTVRFTALVSAPGSFATQPTGTVQFVDGASLIGTAIVTTSGGVSQAILDVPSTGVNALSVGQHVISVQYNGDSTYAPSNSPLVAPTALVQVVNKAATTTTISSSANSANVGQQVTLTATVTVTSPGSGTPTGSVQFINLSAPNQPTVLGTSPLITSAGPGGSNLYTAVLVLSTLPQGNPSIVATYSGDSGYLGSTSTPIVQSVNKTPVNIVLTTSLSPSILGDQVTFAITVTALPPGTGTPTGLITIYDGTNQIGAFTLQGGQYQFVTSSLTVGMHAIGVQYAGDTNFQPFNSPTITQIVNKIPTSLALTSNAPTAIASQIITFTAVLSPNATPAVNFASGQIGFYDGTNLMGVTNLQGNVATINVANLSVGMHQVSAVYLGDDRWNGATSGFYAQTVTPAATNTQIVSSANPSVYGQPVTFTMAVSVPFPGTVPAAGQVQLYDNNNAIGDPINSGNGQFSITIPLLSPGQHSIVARFIANGSFSASQSATLPQVVNKAPTVTTLAVQPSGSTPKQQVTMTAVVTVPPPSLFGLPTAPPLNANLPTGSVQFVNTTFNTVLGTAPIALVGGVYTATLTTDQLVESGSPQILTATYSGDNYFASSTSNPLGQSVSGAQISAVNGAGYSSSNFAPDSWVTIFGDNLSSGQVTAVTTPYPTSLAGTTVALVDATGNTKLLPLYFVSAGQINALIPTNTAFGLATMTVTNPQGATASTIILITRTSPGLFSANANGQGVAAALIQRVRPDNSQSIENVAAYDPATNKMVAVPIATGSDSLYLQLYGTGIRYTPTLSKVTCTIGGVNAPVLYASAAPGFYGLDQVNVQVPAGLTGVVNVVVTVDGQAANTVTLTFK